MALTAKNEGNFTNNIPLIEPGSYPARLVQMVDLGLQAQRPFQGKEKVPANQVRLTYEFLDEFLLDEDGNEDKTKPRFLSESMNNYSRKADRSTAAKRISALDPEGKYDGFHPDMLGSPVVVTVVKDPSTRDPEKVYNNISGVSPMRAKDAEKAPALVNPTLAFDFDEPNKEVFLGLPDWMQKKIKEAVNYPGSTLALLLGDGGMEAEPYDDSKLEDAKDEYNHALAEVSDDSPY